MNNELLERLSYKEEIDKANLDFAGKQNNKMFLNASYESDSKVIWSEGAIVDYVGNGGIRFVVARGSIERFINKAKASGVTKLPLNADHNSTSITDRNIGEADLAKASIRKGENGISHLEVPVEIYTYTAVGRDILERQAHGELFGLSVEIDPESVEVEQIELSNKLKTWKLNNYDITALAVVSNGANVYSNNFTFNTNMENTNQENIIQDEVASQEIAQEIKEEAAGEVVVEEQPSEKPVNAEELPSDDTEQVVNEIETKINDLESQNKALIAENTDLKAKLQKANSYLAKINSSFVVKEGPVESVKPVANTFSQNKETITQKLAKYNI